MRTWTKSACVVLAWSILPIILIATGSTDPSARPTRAHAPQSSTEVTLTSMQSAAAPVTAARPPSPSTSSSTATPCPASPPGSPCAVAGRRCTRPTGGSSARTRTRSAPAPCSCCPAGRCPARYTVAAGDTLSGIAARLAVRGGWLALYAANWSVIGPDPDTIHPGTVLTIPSPAAPRRPRQPSRPRPASSSPRRPGVAPAATGHHAQPGAAGTTRSQPRKHTTGMPQWLKTLLLAVGLLVVLTFLAEPLIAARRRRHDRIQAAVRPPGRHGRPGRARAAEPSRAARAIQGDQAGQDRRAIQSGPDAQAGPVPQLTPRLPGPARPASCWPTTTGSS